MIVVHDESITMYCIGMGNAMFTLTDYSPFSCSILFNSPLHYFFDRLMDESPRWLLQQGRLEESEAVLRKIARRNGTTAPDIATLKAVAQSDQNEAESKKYTYLDLFKSRIYLKRAIILFLTW